MTAAHASCGLPWHLTHDEALAFARAFDDVRSAAQADVPPMALVKGAIALGVRRVVEDKQVIENVERLARMVHLEEEIIWRRPLAADTALWVRGALDERRTMRGGERLTIATKIIDGAGAELARTTSTVFIRDEGAGAQAPAADTQKAWQPPEHAVAWQVAEDQPERWARASGENNPIHLDDAFAQRAGLRGRILHGLCTLAFASRCIIDGPLAGRATKLTSLRTRFARPAYPGETLFCVLEEAEEPGVQPFTVYNAQGQRILSRGLARFARES